MMKKLILVLSIAMLASCAVKKSANQTADSQFFDFVEQLKTSKENGPLYTRFWEAYLETKQTENTAAAYDNYTSWSQKLQGGQVECKDIDLEGLIKQNYISIKPHMLAKDCYENLGDSKRAEYHQWFIEYLLTGVLESGSGAQYYNAFEVGSWGDAEDILDIAGYKVIDREMYFRGVLRGFYYVVHAEDLETKQQRKFFFDNIRFINSAFGYSGRLGNLDELTGLTLVRGLNSSHVQAQIASGDIAVYSDEIDKGRSWYLKATLQESPIAYLRLASLCLLNKLKEDTFDNCLEYLSNAAELEHVDAFIILSELYRLNNRGIQDKDLAEQLFQLADKKLQRGEIYEKLGAFYQRRLFGNEYVDQKKSYFEKAFQHGFVSNRMVDDFRNTIDLKNMDRQQLLRLEQFVQSGNERAKYWQALHLFTLWMTDGYQDIPERKRLIDIAKNYLAESANAGLPDAQYILASLYQSGTAFSQDDSAALKWYSEASNSWNEKAQYELAKILKKRSDSISKVIGATSATRENEYQAFAWMTAAAEQDHMGAINNLGYFYEFGIGTDINHAKAIELYQSAVNSGSAYGAFRLGWKYRYGKGTDVDPKRAFELFSQAFEKGHLGSANELGIMYEFGKHVTKDLTKAYEYYLFAAEKNYQWAQYNIADMLLKGNGVRQDIEKAKHWLSKSYEQGHDKSGELLRSIQAQ